MTSRRTTQPRPSAVDRLIEAFERLRRKKQPARHDLSERVHFVRVQCKQLNALLRLARPHVAKTAYVTARNRVKSAARALSLARDRDVIAKTLRSSIARLPARKQRMQRKWMRTVLTPGDPESIRKRLDQADRKLESVVRRFPRPRDPVQSLRRFSHAGVKRSYREAREGLRDAVKRNRPEDFHRWRKWTKCLQLQLALLDAAGLRVDEGISRALDELQHQLGTHRDLLLAENFAAGQGAAPKALLKLLRDRRVRLERKLLKCGRRFFSAKPAKFARRVLEMAS